MYRIHQSPKSQTTTALQLQVSPTLQYIGHGVCHLFIGFLGPRSKAQTFAKLLFFQHVIGYGKNNKHELQVF